MNTQMQICIWRADFSLLNAKVVKKAHFCISFRIIYMEGLNLNK